MSKCQCRSEVCTFKNKWQSTGSNESGPHWQPTIFKLHFICHIYQLLHTDPATRAANTHTAVVLMLKNNDVFKKKIMIIIIKSQNQLIWNSEPFNLILVVQRPCWFNVKFSVLSKDTNTWLRRSWGSGQQPSAWRITTLSIYYSSVNSCSEDVKFNINGKISKFWHLCAILNNLHLLGMQRYWG